jgi:hypothetical protein
MNPRFFALFMAAALLFAAATDYIPAFIDADGKVFGLFSMVLCVDAMILSSGGHDDRDSYYLPDDT